MSIYGGRECSEPQTLHYNAGKTYIVTLTLEMDFFFFFFFFFYVSGNPEPVRCPIYLNLFLLIYNEPGSP